jgi:hypothetical protein
LFLLKNTAQRSNRKNNVLLRESPLRVFVWWELNLIRVAVQRIVELCVYTWKTTGAHFFSNLCLWNKSSTQKDGGEASTAPSPPASTTSSTKLWPGIHKSQQGYTVLSARYLFPASRPFLFSSPKKKRKNKQKDQITRSM